MAAGVAVSYVENTSMAEASETSAIDRLKSCDRAESRPSTPGRAFVVARVISAFALGCAIFGALSIVILRLVHCFQPRLLPWTLKSAYPLILIGVAFASLQFMAPRAPRQILLGLMVAVAFILWGTEQFLANRAVAAFMDDIVVFLFVLDLSIVVYGHLKSGAHSRGKELPFDQAGD